MALTQVTGPYPIFTDLDGTPLDDGYLYIGEINEDPETNPIQVYWDSALTIVATQPIRTSNGYAYRNGSPALLYTAGEFSITIRNKRQEFVLYSPLGYGFDPAAVSGSVVKNDFVGNGSTVNFTLSATPSTVLATNVFINGVYQEKDSYSLSANVVTFSTAPPLNSSIEIMTTETGVINSGNATAISYTATLPGATAQTVQTKLEQYVSAKDFGAVGDGVADDTAAIQAAINAMETVGGTVMLPTGIYRTTASLNMKYGVSLIGQGRSYRFSGGNIFKGSWIRYRGTPANGAIVLNSVQYCAIRDLGIDCGEIANSVGLFLRSNNNPSCKNHAFERLDVFGAALAVKWGNDNIDAPLEQVDAITFRDIVFNSCVNGFRLNATNVADYSEISQVTMGNLSGVGFDLLNYGFMTIRNCACGSLLSTTIMFKIAGASPDTLRIIGCQNEPNGKFMVATGINDQGTIVLHGNIINTPVEANNILRVASANNFINSTVTTTGFVRWTSDNDSWAGVYLQPTYVKQIFIGASGQFYATSLKNAAQFFGSYLPNNFRIQNGTAVSGGYEGAVVTREGIVASTFIPSGAYALGDVVQPTVNNDHAYIVTVAGTAGTEPSPWPTGSGSTVTSGGVTFQEIGQNAILKNYGAIA